MKHNTNILLIGAVALASVAATFVAPHAAQEQPAMPQLPPGMTQADMQACMAAGTPGKMQERLLQAAGTWHGKSKMWMTAEAEPMDSTGTCTISPMMDGRFAKTEVSSDMPGMGPFMGFGLSAFDNVSQSFQSTWIDNMATGIMTGKGELSSDGQTLSWTYTFNCPITKKPAVMRVVDHDTGKDAMSEEIFTTDPHTGKEFKMMQTEYTRSGGAAAGSR